MAPLSTNRKNTLVLAISLLATLFPQFALSEEYEVAKLLASDGMAGDLFGLSIAVDGDTAVIGRSAGSNLEWHVYVFGRVGNEWVEQARLEPLDDLIAAHSNNRPVAVSGDTIVFGVPSASQNGAYTGSAYVFQKINGFWEQQAKLLASDGETGDGFGSGVAIDGDTIIVGAPDADYDGLRSPGVAYVFARSNGVWSEQQPPLTHTAANKGDDKLGMHVSMDGDIAIIAGALRPGGSVVFSRQNGVWAQEAILYPEDQADSWGFAYDSAIVGDTALLVGARSVTGQRSESAVYVLKRTAGVWSQQAKIIPDSLNSNAPYITIYSVAMVNDMFVVGTEVRSQYDHYKSVAFTFERTGEDWAQQKMFVASDNEEDDAFGFAVGINQDSVLVGSVRDSDLGEWSGSVYVFDNAPPDNEYVIQPGPTDGKDIWTTSVYSYAPGGGGPGGGLDDHSLLVGGWGDYYYSLIEFDIDSLPADVISARVEMYAYPSRGSATTGMYLDRITEHWDWKTQGTGTDFERLWWADRPSATLWNPTALPAPQENAWYSVDITDLYNAWKDGTYPNHGLQLRPVSTWNVWSEFYSSDYMDDLTLRPRLVVEVADTQPPEVDSDGDGMPDSCEIESGLDPNDPSDADQDLDGDGLTNLDECFLGTNLGASDTDGDGISDLDEIQQHSDPNDPDDLDPQPPEILPPPGKFLSTDDDLPIQQTRPTIVLTHGLQAGELGSDDCGVLDPTAIYDLWTGKRDPDTCDVNLKKAAALLRVQNRDVNIIQYVWTGAFQHTGGYPFSIPDRLSYYRGKQNVPDAGAALAKLLLGDDVLGPGYSQPIHFIGHSLGTAVNAYAGRLFLQNAPGVEVAQFTVLDRPDHIDAIWPLPKTKKIRDANSLTSDESRFLAIENRDSELFVERYGYDSFFIPSLLNNIRDGQADPIVKIDNYYSLAGGGVGDVSFGYVYNHPELIEPNDVGGWLFEDEQGAGGVDNNHSGVHQWYRWTINPNDSVFTVENPSGPFTPFCDTDGSFDRPITMHESLNPCGQGWQWSIAAHPNVESFLSTFPSENEVPLSITPEELPILPSAVDGGCTFNGAIISCIEQSSPYFAGNVDIRSAIEFVSFDFRFPTSGDGDYASVLLDGVPIWTMAGSSVLDGTYRNSGLVPIDSIGGNRTLIVALYGVGQTNASFELRRFSSVSVEKDTDGDSVPDSIDLCPEEDSSGFDVDKNGCIDSFNGLADLVESLLAEGVIGSTMRDSLLSKSANAEKSHDKDNICAAINQLESFQNQISAQLGKKISEVAANLAIDFAASVMAYQESQLASGESCQ